MPFKKVSVSKMCAVCSGMGGSWHRIQEKNNNYPSTIWIECACCGGRGHITYTVEEWYSEGEKNE